MRCVLHIGTEKTATTSLQRFADDHRDQLLQAGIAYTRSAGVGNNWRLAVAAYDDKRVDDLIGAAAIDGPASRLAFRSRLIADLSSELHAMAVAGAGTVLFSSEHLQSRLTNASEIDRLAAVLSDLGVTSTQVIIYLRDPVSLAASLHSTMVKHGSTRRTPPLPEPGTYYHLLCDHRASLQRWEAAFDEVTPRLFEVDSLVDGSVVSDLLHTLDLSSLPVDRRSDDPHLNRSLSTAEIEVLARINELVPYAVDGRPDPRHAEVVAALERHHVGPGYRLPPRLTERYREAFAESNEWVRQRFFPEREFLFAAEDPDHDPGPQSPGYDGLAALLGELFIRAT